jgi:hypothetical protein
MSPAPSIPVRRPAWPGALAGLAWLAFLAASAAAAEPVIQACVQRSSGDARIVPPGQACRGNETALQWNVTGPPGAPGPAGGPGPAGPPGPAFFEVVDAAGVVVGPVVSLDGNLNPLVGLRAGGRGFVLTLYQGALLGDDAAYFATPDCSGEAYLQRSTSALPSAVVGPGHRVYVDVGQAPVSLTVQSYYYLGTCARVTWSFQGAPAPLAVDLGLQHTLPFSLR